MNMTDSVDKSFKKIYWKTKLSYYSNALARRIIKRNLSEPEFKRTVISANEGNSLLKEKILKGRPFVAARYGGTETKTIADVMYTMAGGKLGGLSTKTAKRIKRYSGFFPEDKKLLYKFTKLYLNCGIHLDILGVWNIFLMSYLADESAINATLSELRMFEPYYFEEPWSKALEGKKVLVVHPFAELMEKQYGKREKLFENKDILPEFELHTVKAVQTLAGETDDRFKNWFEALDYMYKKCMENDFDVALIGCGAYGMPLAVRLKQAGKQAVHIGGSLQLLFGIKGARWDNHEYISKLYNDYWVRPSDSLKIKQGESVEGSCYW